MGVPEGCERRLGREKVAAEGPEGATPVFDAGGRALAFEKDLRPPALVPHQRLRPDQRLAGEAGLARSDEPGLDSVLQGGSVGAPIETHREAGSPLCRGPAQEAASNPPSPARSAVCDPVAADCTSRSARYRFVLPGPLPPTKTERRWPGSRMDRRDR
jgi:hypothetical protein